MNNFHTFYETEDIWNIAETHKEFNTFNAIILKDIEYTGNLYNAGNINVSYVAVKKDEINRKVDFINIKGTFKIDFSLHQYFKKGNPKGYDHIKNQLEKLNSLSCLDVDGNSISLASEKLKYITMVNSEKRFNFVIQTFKDMMVDKDREISHTKQIAYQNLQALILRVKKDNETRFNKIVGKSKKVEKYLVEQGFKIDMTVENIPIFVVHLNKNHIIYLTYFGDIEFFANKNGNANGIISNRNIAYKTNDNQLMSSISDIAEYFATIRYKLGVLRHEKETLQERNSTEVNVIVEHILDSRKNIQRVVDYMEKQKD